MMQRHFIRRTAAATLGVLALAACSGGGTTGPNSSSAPSSQTSTAKPPVPGPLGALLNQSLFNQSASYLPSLAGGSTYFEVVWCNVEKSPNVFTWRRTDKAIEQARQAGVTTLVKLRTGRCWATGGSATHARGVGKTESAMPKDMSAYERFVTAVVKRYQPQGVSEYAVENETNSASFWDGSPQQYDTLVRAAAKAIRAADPVARVVDSGISSVALGYAVVQSLLEAGDDTGALSYYNAYYARRFGTRGDQIAKADSVSALKAILQQPVPARDLAFFAEADTLARDHIVDVRQVHFYEDPSVLPRLLGFLRSRTPSDVPLEMWELGLYMRDSKHTAQQRADEVVEATAYALAGGAKKVLWLPLIAQSNGRITSNQLFALLTPSGGSTPAAAAFASMASAARGATVVPITQDGIVGVGFDEGSRSTVFVWSTGTTRSIRVAGGVHAAAIGGPAPSTSVGAVSVGTTPVELQLSTTTAQFLSSLR